MSAKPKPEGKSSTPSRGPRARAKGGVASTARKPKAPRAAAAPAARRRVAPAKKVVRSVKVRPAKVRPARRDRSDEPADFRWLRKNRHKYPGEWMALDGDHLVAHGRDLKRVLAEVRAAVGDKKIFAAYEPEPGWQDRYLAIRDAVLEP